MNNYRILITQSDQSAGINFSKCLQLAKSMYPEYKIIGTTNHPIRCQLSNDDITVLLPSEVNKEGPLAILNYVQNIIGAKIDLFYETRSGNRMLDVVRCRDSIPVFMPPTDLVEILEDKFKTYQVLNQHDVALPKSFLLHRAQDVASAIANMNTTEYWVRASKGYGGQGAFSATDGESIIQAIDRVDGWGRYMLSERLPNESGLSWEQRLSDTVHPGEMVNWMAVYHDGELIAAQSRKRLYFEHQSLTPGGVSHTGGIMTLRGDGIFQTADAIIRSLTNTPHGALGIDFLADKQGLLNVTEIQPCRLFTTTHFMAALGTNFPALFVEAARGNPIKLKQKVDPVEPGMIWAQRFGSDSNIIHRDTVLALLKQGFSENPSHQGTLDRTSPITVKAL